MEEIVEVFERVNLYMTEFITRLGESENMQIGYNLDGRRPQITEKKVFLH